jgi:NTP pyrophosphatase (non-canonical NTP hydrolase)
MYPEYMRQIYIRALDKFGSRRQLRMLQEESAELIVAVSHYCRDRETGIAELKEELADVYIMVGQIIEFVGQEEMREFISEKLQKKVRRILDED